MRVGRDKGPEGGGRGRPWLALVREEEGIEGRRGGEVIGLGRTRGFVIFLEPSGGVSDPHKTGETAAGGEEKEQAGKDYNNWNMIASYSDSPSLSPNHIRPPFCPHRPLSFPPDLNRGILASPFFKPKSAASVSS